MHAYRTHSVLRTSKISCVKVFRELLWIVNTNLERKCIRKEHELIKEFVATKDIEFLHQYMKKHTRLRDPLDTWDLEGAAIVKLMNLDKEEFKQYKYFPYDLI
ncbi:TPA: DUF1911 domain-containing protein [Campylobacter coli]|nr:DUF1911 domain-containing protein [Campylobacter coli]HEF9722119.1 DUF1911 domain-containing protein [Campylobacter coli]